jgi:hypothetical protein
VNPDTGEAETPAHFTALAWRRDLDYKIARYEQAEDRRKEAEERAIRQTHAERAAEAARNEVYGHLGAVLDPDRRGGGSIEFLPGQQAVVLDEGR